MTAAERTARIAELNDLTRTAMGVAGRVFQTCGINALPAREQSRIREGVETFSTFTRDNDPYGEHDFGAFEHDGGPGVGRVRVFWKIDYYADSDMDAGAEDPLRAFRVLTIMLAEEY